jgi:hypothetical protein
MDENLSPALRRAKDAARQAANGAPKGSEARARRIGVLMAGQVRTLAIHHEVGDALRHFLEQLRGDAPMQIFACLQRNATYWGAGFEPSSRRQNMAVTKGHNQLDTTLLRAHFPARQVSAALDRLNLPWEIEYTSYAALRAESPLGCAESGSWSGVDVAVQWRGIARAFAMLERHERTKGVPFSHVVRVRPDVCYGRMRLREISLALTSETAGCVHDDMLAIVPRWVAGVYATTHHTYSDCSIDPAACGHDVRLHSVLAESLGGAKAAWQAHAIRHGISYALCPQGSDRRPVLVRPGNADALAACTRRATPYDASGSGGGDSAAGRDSPSSTHQESDMPGVNDYVAPRVNGGRASSRQGPLRCGLPRVMQRRSGMVSTSLAQPLALHAGVPWLALDQSFLPLLDIEHALLPDGRAPLHYYNTGARNPRDASTVLPQFLYPPLAQQFHSIHIEANREQWHAWHAWMRLDAASPARAAKGKAPVGTHEFLPFAVGTANRTLTFEVAGKLGATSHEVGGGHVKYRTANADASASHKVSVPALDFSELLWSRERASRGYVVLKLDIESAESQVLPHLFGTGAICLLDEVLFDCHLNWGECNVMASAMRAVGIATAWAGNFPGEWHKPSSQREEAAKLAESGGVWHGVPLLPCGVWSVTPALVSTTETVQPLGAPAIPLNSTTLTPDVRPTRRLRTVCLGSAATIVGCRRRAAAFDLGHMGLTVDEAPRAPPLTIAMDDHPSPFPALADALAGLTVGAVGSGEHVRIELSAPENPQWAKQALHGLFQRAALCRVEQFFLNCAGFLEGECRMMTAALRGVGVAAFVVT